MSSHGIDDECDKMVLFVRNTFKMKWIDTQYIAESLYDRHPEINPRTINFVNLRQWVLDLDDFQDDPNRCNEKILEAIQQAWIDESE